MKNLLKKIFCIITASMILSCTACGNANEIPISTEHMESLYESTVGDGQENKGNAAATTIQANTAGVHWAEPMRFSKEDINRFLSHCGDHVIDSEEAENDMAVRYSGTTNSGKQFLCLESTGYHPHEVFQYIDQERYNTYNAYPIYSGEELYETNAQYSVGWMFTEPKDFSFSTAEDAEKSVRSALSALGVSDVTLLRTLYIDHSTMEAAGERLATDPAYAPIGEPRKNNGYPIRDDWTEADDAYMFSFGISVEKTTLSTRFEIRDTATYIGSQIIVWYSANGIDYLSVDMPWKVGAVVQEPEKIISSEDALQVARDQIEGILTYQNISYCDPFLEYQYRQAKDKWILYPVWTIKVSYQMMGGSADPIYSFISVDALTGEEL